jgi:hypothetical protein
MTLGRMVPADPSAVLSRASLSANPGGTFGGPALFKDLSLSTWGCFGPRSVEAGSCPLVSWPVEVEAWPVALPPLLGPRPVNLGVRMGTVSHPLMEFRLGPCPRELCRPLWDCWGQSELSAYRQVP